MKTLLTLYPHLISRINLISLCLPVEVYLVLAMEFSELPPCVLTISWSTRNIPPTDIAKCTLRTNADRTNEIRLHVSIIP